MQHQAPQNTQLPLLPPPPPPPPPPVDPTYSLYPTPHYSLPESQNPNPNAPIGQFLRPPGVDPEASVSHGGALYDPALAYAAPPLPQSGDAGAYYQDPNVISALQNWAAEVLRYNGSTPITTKLNAGSNVLDEILSVQKAYSDKSGLGYSSNPSTSTVASEVKFIKPSGSGIWKGPKKTKIVQSAWCEVCRIACNSKDVLDHHKLGKKHQKNLEKLREVSAPPPVTSGVSVNPVIGPAENPDKVKAAAVQNTKKKAAETAEDLETKRRKILEGGAAADEVRICTVCNVACNSEVVFKYHLAGKKHAAMMKKPACDTAVPTTT